MKGEPQFTKFAAFNQSRKEKTLIGKRFACNASAETTTKIFLVTSNNTPCLVQFVVDSNQLSSPELYKRLIVTAYLSKESCRRLLSVAVSQTCRVRQTTVYSIVCLCYRYMWSGGGRNGYKTICQRSTYHIPQCGAGPVLPSFTSAQ
jgi:hypothetical protein